MTVIMSKGSKEFGGSGRTRICDLTLIRGALLPAELQTHMKWNATLASYYQ